MYNVLKRTCRAIVLLIKPIVLGRSRCRRHRGGDGTEKIKIIGLISSTIVQHVRFAVWYIYLPSSAKQKRQMTKLLNTR